MLIIIIFNSPLHNSNVVSELGHLVMLALSLQTQFFLVFSRSRHFWWKPGMADQVVGTEVIRLSVWSFILTQLGAGLYLMFAVAVGARGFSFLGFIFFPCGPWAFFKTPSWTESLSRSRQLSIAIHCCYIGALLLWCWGAGERLASANLVMKSQFLCGLESLDCDIQKCFLGLFSTLMWERKAKRAGVVLLPFP